MSMSYREQQDAVISNGFDETDRVSVKNAIRFRHAWLWDLEDWSFRYGTTDVTFTNGSQIAVPTATDLHAVVALYDSNGSRVRGVQDLRAFFDGSNSRLNLSIGAPGCYTVVDGQIFTDTLGDGTTGLAVYEKSKPMLINDDDTSGLPDGYDLALVHGGKAEMFKLGIVPDLAASFDEDFTAAANALRRNYLRQVKETGQQLGAYTPGQWR